MGKKRKHTSSGSAGHGGSGTLDVMLRGRIEAVADGLDVDGRPTSEAVFDQLVLRHREYQRKSPKMLKQLIHDMLVSRRKEAEAATTGKGNGSGIGIGINGEADSDAGGDGDAVDKHNMLNAGLYMDDRRKAKAKALLLKDAAGQSRKRSRRQQGQGQGQNKGSESGPGSSMFKSATSGPVRAERPAERFSDMGGIESCLQDIREICGHPLWHPEIYQHLGIEPARGVLLFGPPGCGKTMLARAIAGEMGVSFFSISAPEVVSGMSGESEQKLRALFEAAKENAPAIVFIDEIDAITAKRESSSRGMERRIVAQLLTCMDSLAVPIATPTPAADATGDASVGSAAGDDSAFENEVDGKDGANDMVHDTSKSKDVGAGKAKEGDKEAEGEGEGSPSGEGEGDKEQLANPTVLVIGATNRPDSLDPALRRAGRFDREIAMGIPDVAARAHILRCISAKMRLEGEFDYAAVARLTPGFVGADLQALAKTAAHRALTRVFGQLGKAGKNGEEKEDEQEKQKLKPKQEDEGKEEGQEKRGVASALLRGRTTPFSKEELAPVFVQMGDFVKAVPEVQPSAKREGFATVPSVKWEDIGALKLLKEELFMSITRPIQNPEQFRAVGLSAPRGVLLYGPPGCGKTLLAKAIANSSGSNFISVKGPELLNKYVGESERAVRQVFLRAAASKPCVVFFDELDALCPRRGSAGSNGVSERVVNQLLTELDGYDQSKRASVFVIAATNRPDIIDPAVLRPGRLDKLLYVPLPEPAHRVDILQTCARRMGTPLAADVDFAELGAAPQLERFSGADLNALVQDAAVHALRRSLVKADVRRAEREREQESGSGSGGVHGVDAEEEAPQVTRADFAKALEKATPSISAADMQMYASMSADLRK